MLVTCKVEAVAVGRGLATAQHPSNHKPLPAQTHRTAPRRGAGAGIWWVAAEFWPAHQRLCLVRQRPPQQQM